MKFFTFCCAGIFLGIVVNAQTVTSTGTGSNFAIGGSKASWVNTANIAASDNLYATFGNISGAVGGYTDYLLVKGFDFSLIPGGATITGIQVNVERSDANSNTSDFHVQLIKNGIITAPDSAVATLWPTTDGTRSYGSSTALWGNTWTVTDIQNSGASGFGVAFAAKRGASGGATAGKVDSISISVTYLVVLPLKLLDFSLKKINSSVRASWTTTDELNMDHFEVERSDNASDFVSVGSVPNRNQMSESKYSFDDTHPLKNISFYRLKMVSDAGGINYSKIIPVQFSSGNSVIIYPTVWHRGTPLKIANPNNEELTIRFFNGSGQLLGTMTTTSNVITGNGFAQFHGWSSYKVYDDKLQLRGKGKILVE